jgi:hypothetical protein
MDVVLTDKQSLILRDDWALGSIDTVANVQAQRTVVWYPGLPLSFQARRIEGSAGTKDSDQILYVGEVNGDIGRLSFLQGIILQLLQRWN